MREVNDLVKPLTMINANKHQTEKKVAKNLDPANSEFINHKISLGFNANHVKVNECGMVVINANYEFDQH